jgi:hypothetical protein
MFDRHKILAAARAMQTFTAESLATYAQVTRDNVYKVVLDRDKQFFEKVEAKRGKRGRPVTHFRVKPAAIDALANEVSTFHNLTVLQTRTLESVGSNEEATADLLAAESYILDQFPEAESPKEKSEILRGALQHLNNDRRLVPSAARSPRRKVDNALLNLSFDEFAAEQTLPGPHANATAMLYRHASGAAMLYHDARTSRTLYEIVPEMASLPAGFQKDVATRLKKSPLLSRAVAAVELGEEPVMPIVFHGEPALSSPRAPYEIEFLTPDRADATLVKVANSLASAMESCGIHLDIRQYDEPRVGSRARPLVSIVGCNSADPLSESPSASELLGYSDITYVADVGFRSDLRDRVLRSGRQYLSNIGSMEIDVLLRAMQPLPEVINECRLLRKIAEED